jgi:hypothetical protein
MAYGAAPSFDFTMRRAYFETDSHTTTQHERSFHHAMGHPPSIAPRLGNQSIGTAFPAGQRQSFRNGVSAQEHGIEEFSLGSGYPG